MGIRQLLAERTRKKLRFVVLRPKNQSLVATALDRLKQMEGTHCVEDFQQTISSTGKDGFVFVGCLKPKCRTLFNFDGTPSTFTMQPGDVLDEMEDFRKAYESGGYIATGERFNPGDTLTVHESLCPPTSQD